MLDTQCSLDIINRTSERMNDEKQKQRNEWKNEI